MSRVAFFILPCCLAGSKRQEEDIVHTHNHGGLNDIQRGRSVFHCEMKRRLASTLHAIITEITAPPPRKSRPTPVALPANRDNAAARSERIYAAKHHCICSFHSLLVSKLAVHVLL
jgi:hypothetical protein